MPVISTGSPESTPVPSTLDRRLGPLDGAAIVVSNVIGSGIFLVPAFVAQSVPHPWAMLGVWVAGGALAFAGAMAYAELAALRPRAGGEYVYLREAFGPLAAFLTGWTSFVAGFAGAIAAARIRRVASGPSIPGMEISIRIRSGRFSRAIFNASMPSRVPRILYPCASSRSWNSFMLSSLSSTMSTVFSTDVSVVTTSSIRPAGSGSSPGTLYATKAG